MNGLSLIASVFYVGLGSLIVGFALGHAQIAWMESQNKL